MKRGVRSSYSSYGTLGSQKRRYTRSGSRTAIMTLGSGGYGSYGSRSSSRGGFGGGFMSGLQLSGALVATAVVVVLVVIWIGTAVAKPHTRKADTSAGLAYLDTLEQRNPDDVDTILRERHPSILEGWGGIDEISGDNVWQVFKDYVILGDSRAVGFDVFGFLNPERVLAGAGDNINKIDEHLSQVEALQPRYVFIAYGINDVGIGLWPTPQEYADDMLRKIGMLQEKVPNAQIIVNSILPVQGVPENPAWYEIPSYNQALADTCKSNGIIFADNGQIAQEHADLYDKGDYVHLQPAFYQYWGKNMIEAVYNNENHTV